MRGKVNSILIVRAIFFLEGGELIGVSTPPPHTPHPTPCHHRKTFSANPT
ncbi:MAG: hypothetical protein O9295_19310 [Microcystis sp. LE18-22.4A]|nr:hypothetical protein [Microcystis sp. LE18-22.4A]